MNSHENLSVGEVFQSAWQAIKLQPMALLERAGLPVLLSALVGVFVSLYFPGDIRLDENTDPTDPAFAQAVLDVIPVVLAGAGMSFVLIVMFSVAWYRHILVGDAKEAGWNAIKWDSTRTRFLLCMISLALLAGGSAFPAAVLSGLVGFPPIIASFLMILVPVSLFGRLCLCLPGVAAGETVSFGDSWRMTRGLTMKMGMISFLPLVPTFLVSLVVLTLASSILGAIGVTQTLTAAFVLSITSEAIVFSGYALQAGAIAEAYKALKDRPRD